MPFTLFEEPAGSPLIVGPVALMKLVEVDDVDEISDTMRRLRLGPTDLSSETKWNGWLTQAPGGHLWSKNGKIDMTRKFPEIAAAIEPYAGSSHLLGEIVYWTPEGKMNLPTVGSIATTKSDAEAREKRRALPGHFEFILFDAIALRGYDISKHPTYERYEMLLDSVDPRGPIRISQLFPFDQWETAYEAGVVAGGDGVVIKNLHAPYVWRPLGEPEPRPIGTWYKVKPSYNDDFVVYGTQRGPKGSLLAQIGQFHEGRLVEVGVLNNFSTDTEAEILERLQQGPFVMEVEYTARFPDTGALQHPRFSRFRDDKNVHDALLPERYAP